MDDELSKVTDEVPPEGTVDLSVLEGLDFGPDWGRKSPHKKSSERSSGTTRSTKKKPFRRGKASGGPRSRSKIDKPTKRLDPDHLVSFFPEAIPFANLIREMKTTCRTYSLFDLAKLILEKPERFVVMATPVEKPSEEASYFVTKPDGVAFTTREEACAHLMDHHGESFFEVEQRESEGPKGSFTVVNKCGITGELLAPPNYHRYAEFIREHHTTHLPNVSFEKFQRRIETEKSPETVDAWLEGMKKVRVYRLKDRSEEEPEIFETREALQRFLMGQRFSKFIKKVRKARFSGICLATLPSGTLKRDVELALGEQIRYPLTTATMLRRNFRKMKFAVYKRGSKGITFVCAIKRKIRTPETVFASSIQALLDFLDHNPKSRKSELIERFLGFAPEERTEEQEETVRQLARDFRWLVTEGYVTEFADGILLLSPVTPSPKATSGKAKQKQKARNLTKSGPSEETQIKKEESSSILQLEDTEAKPPANPES